MSLLAQLARGVAAANPPEGTFWLPPAISSVAREVDWVFYLVLWISVFFFLLIVALMVVFLFKYRARPGHEVEPSPAHNIPLEITWIAIPLLLVLVIFYYGFRGFMNMITPPGDAYEIQVTAQKWNWLFTYPNGYTDATLHVPVDRPVELTMVSEDVIHSFYVPAFRIKRDVVPGRYNKTWFEANAPGQYVLFCAEYCGTSHSDMIADVVVHPSGEFEKWLREASDFLATMSPVDAGRKLYEVQGCGQCHSVDGTPGVGPTFQGLFGRTERMASGVTITADENYIRESILEPQAQIVAGYEGVMPTYQGRLNNEEISAIITYIKSISGIDVSGEDVAPGAEGDVVAEGETVTDAGAPGAGDSAPAADTTTGS